jgi:inorganic pyrophosphatase
VLLMRDEKGDDAKVLCVALNDPEFGDITSLDEIAELRRAEIEHFFAIYKELEPGKGTEIIGWRDATVAQAVVAAATAARADTPPS